MPRWSRGQRQRPAKPQSRKAAKSGVRIPLWAPKFENIVNQVVGNVIYVPIELDDKLREEAAKLNIKHTDLILKYLKLGMKTSAKQKQKEKGKK